MLIWYKIELNIFEGCDILNSEKEILISSIRDVRSELERAQNLCDELTDEGAIDYASYNLLAQKAKYSYLLQIAKKMNLTI